MVVNNYVYTICYLLNTFNENNNVFFITRIIFIVYKQSKDLKMFKLI